MKLAISGALALALSPATEANTSTSFIRHPYIEKLSCDGGSGSGFKLDTGQWVSVWHVVRLGGCTMDGKPITVTYQDERGDFALFSVDDDRKGGIPLDCSGFKDGQWYFGTGHARGLPFHTVVTVMASKMLKHLGSSRGWEVLIYSRYIPGQSGGPALNQFGGATGTINAFNHFYQISFSRALADTVLCK